MNADRNSSQDSRCYELSWEATANEVASRCSIVATTRASISGVVCRPQAGLLLAQQAATLATTAGSHALQGLALLHVGEGYAMLGDRRECEAALGTAETHLQAMQTNDPAHGLLRNRQ
jgi:hypothetical protein